MLMAFPGAFSSTPPSSPGTWRTARSVSVWESEKKFSTDRCSTGRTWSGAFWERSVSQLWSVSTDWCICWGIAVARFPNSFTAKLPSSRVMAQRSSRVMVTPNPAAMPLGNFSRLLTSPTTGSEAWASMAPNKKGNRKGSKNLPPNHTRNSKKRAKTPF